MSAQFKTQSNDILEHVRDKSTQREETAVGIKQCAVTWKLKQTFWQVLRTRLSAKKPTFYRFYSNPEVSLRKHAVLHMFMFFEFKGGQSAFSEATQLCHHTSTPAWTTSVRIVWFLPCSVSTTHLATGGLSSTWPSSARSSWARQAALLLLCMVTLLFFLGKPQFALHCARGSSTAGSLPLHGEVTWLIWECQILRIIEEIGLEGSSEGHPVQPPCNE